MFRRIIEENARELKSINKSVSKIRAFQKKLDGSVKKVLGQKIGDVKKTLPVTREKMDECMKMVGDADLCGIIMTKYDLFYNQICKATPALCDDHHLYPSVIDINALKKQGKEMHRI